MAADEQDHDQPPLLRPTPRRPTPAAAFSLTPLSTTNSSTGDSPDRSSDSDSQLSKLDSATSSSGRPLPSATNGGSFMSSSNNDTSSNTADTTTSPGGGGGALQQKTRSILNLTSSTLLGIYSSTGYDGNRTLSVDANSEPLTPWGAGAQTPLRSARPSRDYLDQHDEHDGERDDKIRRAAERVQRAANTHNLSPFSPSSPRHGSSTASAVGPAGPRRQQRRRNSFAPPHGTSPARHAARLAAKSALLFAAGWAYGALVSHLHDERKIAPVRVDGIPRGTWVYACCWGLAGVVLGWVLPWVDRVWAEDRKIDTDEDVFLDDEVGVKDDKVGGGATAVATAARHEGLGADWNPIVRSIGAFVGIAFAIRRLPWQSTLQVSLTLALVNPFIWYLIDRTRTGLYLSTLLSLTMTTIFLAVNPDLVPAPSYQSPIRLPHQHQHQHQRPTRSFASHATSPTAATDAAAHGLPGLLSQLIGTLFGATAAAAQNMTAAVPSVRPESALAASPMSLAALGLTYESIGVATWLSSVFFCSCVCFGNIGRWLVGR